MNEKVFDYGAVEFVKNGRSSREEDDSFSLDENNLLLIRMKFTDSIHRFALFVHFREFFAVFRDFKKSDKLVAYGIAGFDPSYYTVFKRPHIGIAVLNKFLRYICLPFMRAAP